MLWRPISIKSSGGELYNKYLFFLCLLMCSGSPLISSCFLACCWGLTMGQLSHS